MTAAGFREMALSFSDAIESSHMGHPDFRAGGKIFATLGYPGDTWGMVKLTPEQQQDFVQAAPEIFMAVKGGWGAQGATRVCLEEATRELLQQALSIAWSNVTAKPKSKKVVRSKGSKKKSKQSGR